jgi:hypothetical protein
MFIKTIFKDQKRKFKIAEGAKYAEVLKELVRCYGEQVKSFDIGYIDDENEFIRIINDDEWEVCVEEALYKNKGKAVNTVTLMIQDGGSTSRREDSSITESTFVVPTDTQELKNEVLDWKVINKETEPVQEKKAAEVPAPVAAPVERSIFEDPVEEAKPEQTPAQPKPQTPTFSNPSNEDVLLELNLTGTKEEMERQYQTILHDFVPNAGFEIDACILTTENEVSDLKKRDAKPEDSILDNSRLSEMSSLSRSMRDEIESLIEEKLKKYSGEKRESFSKKTQPETVQTSSYDHSGVTCDNCRKRISNSCRFKSLVKPDFDLCEQCEATGIHPEPMIKIREPLKYGLGWRLNSHFQVLKNLFQESEQPVPVAPSLPAQRSLVHIRNSREAIVESAEKALKEVSSAIESKKEEQKPAQPAGPRLCHIRTAEQPKKPVVEQPKTPVAEVKVEPTSDFEKLLTKLARMFPAIDVTKIREFIKKNEGIPIDDLVNRFLDQCFN